MFLPSGFMLEPLDGQSQQSSEPGQGGLSSAEQGIERSPRGPRDSDRHGVLFCHRWEGSRLGVSGWWWTGGPAWPCGFCRRLPAPPARRPAGCSGQLGTHGAKGRRLWCGGVMVQECRRMVWGSGPEAWPDTKNAPCRKIIVRLGNRRKKAAGFAVLRATATARGPAGQALSL